MQDISDGRMVMGIGRGDSSRRVVGLQPVKVAEFEQRCAMIKDLMNGRSVDWNEKELELKWVREELPDIPMWIAGYGPKALAVAGRVADGVIIQLADPVIVQWIMDTARRAAEEAGRDPSELKCIVGAPSHISDDIADAREQSRWFPAMVSNHVMDLIERYGEDSEIPRDLTDFAADGWRVAGVARSEKTIRVLTEDVPGAVGVIADASKSEDLERVFHDVGDVDLIVNAITTTPTFGGPIHEAPADALAPYSGELLPAIFNVLRLSGRVLVERGGGTLIQVTGGSPPPRHPSPGTWGAARFPP